MRLSAAEARVNNPSDVFAFEVWVHGTDWKTTVNARTAGKAKRDYHLDVIDAWPDVPYTAMRCRKLGPPQTSREFERNARYRGLPQVKCGDRVWCGTAVGRIVGHNDSANFDVLFDDDSPKYAGLRLNVHPSGCSFGGPA